MSKATAPTSSKPAASQSNTPATSAASAAAAAAAAGAPAARPTSTFNYAAAAAKSKATAATPSFAAAASGTGSGSQATSGAATPISTGASTPASQQQQQSSLPAAGTAPQNGSRASVINGAPSQSQSSHNRRQSAVSVAKGQSGPLPIGVTNPSSRDSINFGSIAEANTLLSSSPATWPEAIRPPRQFGSVEAASPSTAMNGAEGVNASKDAAAPAAAGANPSRPSGSEGSGVATPAVRTAKPQVNFLKLFQNNASGSSPGAAPGAKAAPSAASSQAASAPSLPSTTSTPGVSAAASTTGDSTRPSSTAASTQSQTPSSSTATTPAPSQQNTPAQTPSMLNATPSRVPSSTLRPNGSQPFQPGRTASGPHVGPGARVPSGAPGAVPSSPFAGPNQQQVPGMPGQVQRSPNVPHAGPQPMHMGQQPWHPMQQYPGAQFQGYAHPGYAYQGPGGWQPPHQGYDMPGSAVGAPRSPRHPNMPTSPMPPGAHQLNGAPAASPMHSPGQTRSQPAGPGGIGLGQPPTPQGRAPSFPSAGSGAFVPPGHAHGHSHSGSQHGSFSGPAGPNSPMAGGIAPMSPSARNFEPKRTSAAIKIVNPDTKAALDVSGFSAKSPAVSNLFATAAGTTPSTSSSGAPSPVPAPATATKAKTHDNFMEKVRAAAAAAAGKPKDDAKQNEEKDRAKEEEALKAKEEEARKAKEEEARKAKEEEERNAKEEEAARQAKEEAERKAKEEAEQKAKEEEERKAQAEAERKAKEAEESKAKEEQERKAKEEQERKTQEEQKSQAAAEQTVEEVKSTGTDSKDDGAQEKASRPLPKPIDTKGSFKGSQLSTADIERLAREASSVPSTPHEGVAPRTPGLPSATPRTPSTPGFAGLPAKPLSSMTSSGSAGSIASVSTPSTIKLDAEALEKRKRPVVSALDVSAANKMRDSDVPLSAASVSLGSARRLHNLDRVDYGKMKSPKPELNEDAAPGKYRYDRDFLLQFMDVVKDKPPALPSLSSLGMDNASIGGAMPPRTGSGRRASGVPGGIGGAAGGRNAPTGLGLMGPGSAFGGKSPAPLKTSEERFAASSMRPPGGGGMGSFGSGPMGAFNAPNRSQPLSRGGSGSNALPGRDDGRSKSGRGRQREPNLSRMDRGSHVNPPEKGGPTIPLDQVAPLANSENRWVPQAARSTVKPDSPEMVQRKVKALLNKLTLEKFDSISQQILDWANKSVNETDGRTLRQVIALIFEKATDEAAFSEMYARLCFKIYGKLDPKVSDADLKDANGAPVSGGALFRKYLLNRCQEDFERGWAQRESTQAAAKSKEAEDKAKKERNDAAEAEAKAAEERGEKVSSAPKEAELLSDEYYELAKAKRRGLGLVRFVGELFIKGMLSERIMHLCLKQLLVNVVEPEEEDIESLCKLLTTVGEMMDASTKHPGVMDIYFQRMHDIVDNGKINSRMRFMLLDVIELREKQKWKARHAQAKTGPKTIAEVHEEARAAQMAKEAESMRSRAGPVSRGGSRRGQLRDGYGGPMGPGADGWNTVGGAAAAPPPRAKAGDLSGFGSITRTSSKGPPQFGPANSFFSKRNVRASEDGSQPPTRTNSHLNIFAALTQTEDTEGTATLTQSEETGRPTLKLQPRTKPLPGQESSEAADAGAEGSEDDHGDEEEDDDDDEGPKAPASMTDDEAKQRIEEDVKEFLNAKDVASGVQGFKLLPEDRRSQAVAEFVDAAINKKEADVQIVTKLFEALHKDGVVSDDQAADGFKDSVPYLQDSEIDIPNVFKWIAGMLVALGLPRARIEELADTMENEDNVSPSPKDKLLAKVDERIGA